MNCPYCPYCGNILRSSPDIDDSPSINFCANENCEYNTASDADINEAIMNGMVADEYEDIEDHGEMDEYYPSDSDETDKDLP